MSQLFTALCYKLLERLALERISSKVDKMLSQDQAGFRKGRSTCDQFAALTTYTENGFQQNLKNGTIFIDLTAAYDTVWHTGLLAKLTIGLPYWFTRAVETLLRGIVSDSTWSQQRVYGEGRQTDFLPLPCSTYTQMTCQPPRVASSFMQTISSVVLKPQPFPSWSVASPPT
jgi:hypothetical protein